VFRDASAGLVVPSCELAVARVHSRVPSSRAGMLTLSTVWPEPGLREQPPSIRTEREDGQGQTQLFSYAPVVAEPPELFQVKCLSPALEARPHLNGNNPSIPRM
jgi:hypothetical protein